MALVKNQSLPAGEPLMFENPGDELYFGEVYRQILQEAWLPGGGEVWSIVGKSRRGHRPSLRGITGPNVTPSQTEIRRWFSKCAAAWDALPWEFDPLHDCDNRNPKKYWKDEKDRRGLMCSYYDLYMRYCLRFALDTGCIPPANYLLAVEGNLTNIDFDKVYDLSFPNKCGDVSFVSGVGEFIPPGEWLSPSEGTEGELCFHDANGSLGWIPYSFEECLFPLEYDPDNPTVIAGTGSVEISVLLGDPPFTWSAAGTEGQGGYSFAQAITQGRSNTLFSESACGAALITVTDVCSREVTGYLRCTAGGWVSTSLCVDAGPDGFHCFVTSGKYKYYVRGYGCGVSCDYPGWCHLEYLALPGWAQCIVLDPYGAYPGCTTGLRYMCLNRITEYEWKC